MLLCREMLTGRKWKEWKVFGVLCTTTLPLTFREVIVIDLGWIILISSMMQCGEIVKPFNIEEVEQAA
jgi:hypothetical protein